MCELWQCLDKAVYYDSVYAPGGGRNPHPHRAKLESTHLKKIPCSVKKNRIKIRKSKFVYRLNQPYILLPERDPAFTRNNKKHRIFKGQTQ